MTSTAAFISELVRAANEIDRLTKDERARLMRRASATIRDMREKIDCSDAPANDNNPLDIAIELREMARLSFMFKPSEIAQKMLEGAETIRTLTILLGIKEEILEGDE
jgi:hypothetical protein